MAVPHTLWYTRCPVPTAFSIAVQQGTLHQEFAADGIAVRSLASSSDRNVRQSHFDATQSSFFRHGGNGPPLIARSRGADIRVVALSWNKARKAVLTLPETGIRSAADLKGRRISIPRRVSDSVDFWRAAVLRGFGQALRSAGLSFDDVEQVEVATGRTFVEDTRPSTEQNASLWDARFMLGHQREEAFALVRGEVDAIYSHGAIAAIVEGFLGTTTVADLGERAPGAAATALANNDFPYVLTASGQLIDEQPELVERWLARVLAASAWARSHERQTKQIIAAETGLAVELVDHAYSPSIHQELDLDTSPEQIEALRSQYEHLRAYDFLKQPFDLAAFIDPRPLAAARELLAKRPQSVAA
jgi:ABC-type nitrate/sulfonate/bicarbonate transport system substrate-binding protein